MMNLTWNGKQIQRRFEEEANRYLGNLENIDMFKVLEVFLREMKELQKVNLAAEETPLIELKKEEKIQDGNDEGEETKVECKKMKQLLAKTTRVHKILAKNFYKLHLTQKYTLQFEGCNYDNSSSELEWSCKLEFFNEAVELMIYHLQQLSFVL